MVIKNQVFGHVHLQCQRAYHGAASAQGAAVVDQGFPVGQVLIGQWFGKTQCAGEFAPEGVFLLPDLAQRVQFVDRGVFWLTCLGEEQAGLGA